MATIIIRNSTGSGVVPSSLVQGELAINTKDGKLYYGSGSGNIVKEFTGSSTPTFPYTGSAIISGSLTVTGSFYVSNSIDSNNRYLIGSNNAVTVDWENTSFNDSSGNGSISATNRRLTDSSGNASISWEDRNLLNSAATTTVDWQTGVLNDSTSAISVDWERRKLKDTVDTVSLDYEERKLIANDDSTAAISWATPGTVLFSGSLIPAGPYTNNTSSYDLGSPTAAWKDLYVSNGSIKLISGSQSASISFTNGALNFGTTPISSSNVLTTASVSSNTITFTKGDGSTFPITVATGSGGGTQKIYNFIQSSDGTAITGTTNTTLTSTLLIPANTVAVGDSISLKVRAIKTGTAGTSRVFTYANTSATISGATLLASGPNAAAANIYHQVSREFVITSATTTQGLGSGTALITDDNNTSVSITNSNIDWTVDQYIVFAINNASAADSTKTTYARATVLKP